MAPELSPFNQLRQRAQESSARVVLPESADERILKAAAIATSERLANIVLLGKPEEVAKLGESLGVSLSGVEIVDYETSPKSSTYAQTLFQLRKHKGVTENRAAELIRDPVYFAAVMVHLGDADAYVAGASLPTARVLRPALQVIGPAPGVSVVSSFVPIDTSNPSIGDDGLLVIADAGVVPDPNPEQLADIAVSTAFSYQILFGRQPRLAFLSYSTKGSAAHPLVEKVAKATQLAREKAPRLILDGELQADSALVPEVAARKCPESPVAGRANILIAPDLNVGNISYKLVQRLSGGQALGPLIQGLAKPANDLSRGSQSEEIVDVIAATAVRAAAQPET